MLKHELPPLPDHPDPHLLASWDRHLAAQLSANTRRAYRDDLATFAGWTGSHAVTLADVDGRAVREYLSWLATRGNGGQPYARTSVTRKLAALRSFYAYLQRRGWFEVTPIPSARALKVKMPRPLPRFLGRTEAARLMAAPPVWTPAGRRDRAILEFAYGTGVRLGELAALDVADLDRHRVATVVTGKGGHSRRVLYGVSARASLDLYLDYGRPAILAGAGEVGDGAALWLNLEGGRLSRRSIAKMVRRHADAVGLASGVTVHVLRHSYALAHMAPPALPENSGISRTFGATAGVFGQASDFSGKATSGSSPARVRRQGPYQPALRQAPSARSCPPFSSRRLG